MRPGTWAASQADFHPFFEALDGLPAPMKYERNQAACCPL